MRFEETFTVPASLDESWEFLWDFQQLASCLPGCVGVTEIETERRYAARFEDRIGQYRVGFDMDIEVVERTPKSFVRLLCTGEDRRLRTSQRVALSVMLEPADAKGTQLTAVAEVTIIGVLATLGQFVVKRKAKDIVQKFARNIEAALAVRSIEGSHA